MHRSFIIAFDEEILGLLSMINDRKLVEQATSLQIATVKYSAAINMIQIGIWRLLHVY